MINLSSIIYLNMTTLVKPCSCSVLLLITVPLLTFLAPWGMDSTVCYRPTIGATVTNTLTCIMQVRTGQWMCFISLQVVPDLLNNSQVKHNTFIFLALHFFSWINIPSVQYLKLQTKLSSQLKLLWQKHSYLDNFNILC